MQIEDFERLYEDRCASTVVVSFMQFFQQLVFEEIPAEQLSMVSILEVGVISGMLDFRIDANGAAGFLTLTFSQRNHFVQGRNLIQTIILLITVCEKLERRAEF